MSKELHESLNKMAKELGVSRLDAERLMARREKRKKREIKDDTIFNL